MTNEDKTTTGSSKPDSAEQVQSPPPEDDAILRNLEALIGNDLQNKGNFKAAPPLAESDNELQVADNEEINTSAEKPEVRDVHHAAQLRRSTRLLDNTTSEHHSENEIDVIFDEETDASEQSTIAITENPSSDDSPPPHQPDEDGAQQSMAARSLSTFELCGICFLFMALAGLGIIFAMKISSLVNDYRQSATATLTTVPETATGKLLKLEGIQFYWRDANSNDRVQEGSNILPVIQIESIKGTGALQIIFRDELGKIRGDSHIQEITSVGKFSAHGTSGMANDVEFTDHKLETGLESNEYWTATINESSDQINWAQIGQYRLTAERR